MSKIVLIVRDLGPRRATVLAEIRKTFQIGFPIILNLVGTNAPLVERKLFDRNDPEFTERVLSLLRILEVEGVDFIAYELLDEQEYSVTGKYFELSSAKLKNIIDANADTLEEQIILGRLEDGVS